MPVIHNWAIVISGKSKEKFTTKKAHPVEPNTAMNLMS